MPSATRRDFSSRPRTSETVIWDPPASLSEHELLYSPDISRIVAEILLLPGWRPGNSMGFFVEYMSGSGGAPPAFQSRFHPAPRVLLDAEWRG